MSNDNGESFGTQNGVRLHADGSVEHLDAMSSDKNYVADAAANVGILGTVRNNFGSRPSGPIQRKHIVSVRDPGTGHTFETSVATAIHMEPELLVIDEILAVGDAAFRRKCNDALWGLKRRGVTILFVSHNEEAVYQFCDRALLLSHGQAAALGPTDDVVTAYARLLDAESETLHEAQAGLTIYAAAVLNHEGFETLTLTPGEPWAMELAVATPPGPATIDGETHDASWLVVANAARYGGPFTLSPRTNVVSPGFNVVVSRATSRRQRFWELFLLGLGRLEQARTIEMRPARGIEIHDAAALPVQVDGEPFAATAYRIEADVAGTYMIVPAASGRRSIRVTRWRRAISSASG